MLLMLLMLLMPLLQFVVTVAIPLIVAKAAWHYVPATRSCKRSNLNSGMTMNLHCDTLPTIATCFEP